MLCGRHNTFFGEPLRRRVNIHTMGWRHHPAWWGRLFGGLGDLGVESMAEEIRREDGKYSDHRPHAAVRLPVMEPHAPDELTNEPSTLWPSPVKRRLSS